MSLSFKKLILCTTLLSGVVFTACSTIESVENSTADSKLSADIRYTGYGVPHIKSDTYEGLGFGLAYAFAGDNICLMAEQYLTLRGERAKYFGSDTFYHDMFAEALGEKVYNEDSDFYHRLVYSDVAAFQKGGASSELQKLAIGWVEGYNKYIEENAGNMPIACNDADWVMPITEDDVYKRFLQSYLLGGYGTFMKSMADAMKPDPAIKNKQASKDDNVNMHASYSPSERYERLSRAFEYKGYGSNAIAFGKELTPAGQPMMFGNPHFPWQGAERLYQMHLTIPGEYDVAGGALYGVPFPQIGFNKEIAWSVTWSTDVRFIIRELELSEENPQQYYVDGKTHNMDVEKIDIEVKGKGGELTTQTRLAYSTIYGPLLAGQYFKGEKTKAFAITDFNVPNNRAIETFFQLGRSKSVQDIDRSQDELTGSPYSNVTAVDASGQVYYANKSVAANISDAQIETCIHGATAQYYKKKFSILVLDGSDSSCDPQIDPASPQEGIIAGVNKPSIIRTDYAAQTNDSHWIVNEDPDSYMTGYGYVVGPEMTERGDRLRYAIDFINARKTNADGLGGNDMTPEHMKTIFYQAGLKHGELLRDDLIADCTVNPIVNNVDLSEACEVLKGWDMSESASSVGTHIFREFYRNLTAAGDKDWWRIKFDPEYPLETPRGLAVSQTTRMAFAKAVSDIKAAGIPLDAQLSDIQFVMRNGEKVPFSGGQGFHNISMKFVPGIGYTEPILLGNSYIMAVAIGEDGPKGYEINSYSQSTDPNSVHSYDQTKLYGNEEWVKIRFTDEDIRMDPEYRFERIER